MAEDKSPSPGALLWYYPAAGDQREGQPGLAAFVASVVTENSVNVMVIDSNGVPMNKGPVLIVHAGESTMGNEYCVWPGEEIKPAPVEEVVSA